MRLMQRNANGKCEMRNANKCAEICGKCEKMRTAWFSRDDKRAVNSRMKLKEKMHKLCEEKNLKTRKMCGNTSMRIYIEKAGKISLSPRGMQGVWIDIRCCA